MSDKKQFNPLDFDSFLIAMAVIFGAIIVAVFVTPVWAVGATDRLRHAPAPRRADSSHTDN